MNTNINFIEVLKAIIKAELCDTLQDSTIRETLIKFGFNETDYIGLQAATEVIQETLQEMIE